MSEEDRNFVGIGAKPEQPVLDSDDKVHRLLDELRMAMETDVKKWENVRRSLLRLATNCKENT